jgi:AmmeMemoRadiSam system protein B
VPISYSLLDYSRHIEFGEALKNLIANTPERIAVIASGDMSHCLSQEAPGGFATEGKIFDESIIKLLSANDLTGLFSLNPKLIEGAGECGFRSLLILLGIIKNINWRADILSYEAPFGVGYLTVNFRLS